MKVKNKTIVVTGGGNGVGRELVLYLVKKGANIVAIDINKKALEETRNLAGSEKNSISNFVLDITNREAVYETVDKIIIQVGNIDGLINNAGIIQPFVRLNDLSYEAIERVFNVNFFGTLYPTKALLSELLKRPEAHIVNISSMGGFLPVPGQIIYGAAKAGVKIMTEGLQAELANSNVGVTVVFPGAINTNIKGNSGLTIHEEADTEKANKILSPEKAAQLIIEGIEKNKGRILLGKDSKFMDIIYRIKPQFAVNFIAKKMQNHLQ